LALADAYAALNPRPARTMIFVAFWGEESGLLGSRELVKRPVWPIDKTLAMINLEMLGRPEPGASGKTWVTGWEQSDLGSLMAVGAERVGVDIFEHPRYSAMLYRASDNWPFAEAGVIAHSFSAGSLHSDYHQPGDSWEKLETRHMTEVIRGLFAGSLPLAQGKLTPRKSANR
jgi:Zn-dependent M28 family amino/carboxypeptidase